MATLDTKWQRELWRLRGQILAICLVIGCGVATFVMSLSTLDSLRGSLDSYYERTRFAQIFGNLKRAPRVLLPRLAEVPGVRLLHEAPVLRELALELEAPVGPVLDRCAERGIAAGIALGDDYPEHPNGLLVALTEQRSPEDVERLASALAEAIAELGPAAAGSGPEAVAR